MERKINVTEVCKAYNSAREQNSGRKGDSKWVIGILKSFGISGNIAGKMLKESALLQQYHRENAGRGNYKGYIFPCTPVHVSWFQNWLSPSKKSDAPKKNNDIKDKDFEVQCKKYLEELGYTVKRFVLDEQKLKEKYPEIWEECLVEDDSI